MTAEALHRLTSSEYTDIWDRFDATFDFRPSINAFRAVRAFSIDHVEPRRLERRSRR